jgi:type IV pilus assembly protein PilC
MDKKGSEVSGIVEADSLALAINEVRSMGYFPTKVNEATSGQKRRAEKGSKGVSEFYIQFKIKTKELVMWTRQLSTLIDAGLPLLRSLHVLHGQLKPCKLRDILRLMIDDIQAGTTFSEALAKHPKEFDRLFVNMVRAGEIGGMLEVVLSRLADYMERRQALRRQVRSAMIYPIAVLSIATAIVGFLMVKVIPTFAEIFTEFGSDLPALTQFLVDMSNWLATYYWLLMAYTGGTLIFVKLMRKIPHVQRGSDWVALKLPLMGGLIVKIAVARFSRTLGTLLTSGVPILQALKIVRETIGNYVIEQAVDKVHDSIREGETIAAPLEETNVFPTMVVNMIDVGEETGQLDQMLMKVADVYDDEVETTVATLLQLMEPAMIIILGFIVGTIVIAMYLPIFTLGDAINN